MRAVREKPSRLDLVDAGVHDDDAGAGPDSPNATVTAPGELDRRSGRPDDGPAGPQPPAARQRASLPIAAAAAGQRRLGRNLVIGTVGLVLLAAAGWYGERWWTVGRFIETTDDAYVRADNRTLAAKVAGYVSAIPVPDNARVHEGEIIATIDDGDYRLAVDAARGKVATQRATLQRIDRQIEAQGASVEQAAAQLASAQAGLTRAQSDLERQQSLAAKDFASRQTLEQAQANRDQGVAAVQGARAGVAAAKAAVAVLEAQRQEAARGLDELETALAKAERDLSFTVIRAPIDGVLGNRAVQSGDYVQPGQRLAALVPLDAVYIEANFKETQLAAMRAGQPASLTVDAVPGRAIETTVASVAPASGSVFSLLPPDNATGNFTKIVQRVPVRIRVPADIASQSLLRPGMSVVVSVNTKSTGLAPGGAAAPRRAAALGAAPRAR